MRVFYTLIAWAISVVAADDSLSNACASSHIQSSLPPSEFLQGITILASSVESNPVTDYSVNSSTIVGDAAASNLSFCNVTFEYTHDGLNDSIQLWYWLPEPGQFRNRFLATGGGGFAITSGEDGLAQGLPYGAVSGTTDAGLGGFDAQLTDVILLANGTMDYEALFMFSHKAIHEMSVLGKEFTARFYGTKGKVYSYYQGCSEGGREGLSQIQRYGSQFDGASIGAPALRMAFQQVLHLFSALVEITDGYYPSACEMSRITNDTIAACDPLDGKTDGVVSRTDLCKLHYNATSSIGHSYACPAAQGSQLSPYQPATDGTVSAQAAKVANEIWKGIFDSHGRQVYLSFQPTADFEDATGTYNNATGRYEPTISGIGVQWVNYFLKKVASAELDLKNATYDTLRTWILQGTREYSDTLQTNWPDLADYRENGGKILHWHGESDPSIPSGSSVLYQESVRRTMYPGIGFDESYESLNEWYRLFLVPGAAHCGRSSDQASGPFPNDLLGSVIQWVENDVAPDMLNATTPAGERQDICKWPLRPMWKAGGTGIDCVFDQQGFESWTTEFSSIPVPVW